MSKSDKQKKYLLYLINPKRRFRHYSTQYEFGQILGKKNIIFPLALPILAALTPDHYEIKLIDNETDPIPFDRKPDIVGITSTVSTINNGYEIAEIFRKMGSVIVFGGPYASFKEDEILQHADSLVVGEAEGLWEKLLMDFENNNLQKKYFHTELPEFKTNVHPRWDLVDTKNISAIPVQVSRGCPYKCEFCNVTKMFGHKMRYRDIDDVIEEIKNLPLKRLFFADDNLTFNKAYAKRLAKALKPLGVSYSNQSSVDIAEDDELLKDMSESGCLNIFVGFESVNPKSISETHKSQNVIENYEILIKKINSFGINIMGSFVIGFDSDTIEDFQHIFDFTHRNNIYFTILSVMTVTPGTDHYERMKKNNRLLEIDPDFACGLFPCMKYTNISVLEMYDNFFLTLEKLFSIETLSKRGIDLLKSGTFNTKPVVSATKFGEAFYTFMTVVKRFYFSKDKQKKELFKTLFKMGRKNIVSMEQVVVFLLVAESFLEYSKYLKDIIPKNREIFKKIEENNKI